MANSHNTNPATLAAQRVVLLHNRYRQLGGEERYVAQLTELLERRSESVVRLERASEDKSNAAAGLAMVRGGGHPDQIGAAVKEIGATIVHAHNIYPGFGWRALAAAREAGAATVLHLHNYRLFCAIGIAYRNGHDCVECAPRRMRAGLAHNCRGNLAEAAAYATGLGLWQPKLIENVDLFVSPTRELADDLKQLGLEIPIEVLPTWLPDGDLSLRTDAGDGEYGLYAGRVTEEKGILDAVSASARAGAPLRIAGDGPDLDRARRLAKELDAPVDFLGRLEGQAMVAARMGAAYCILPSRWREVLPFSALEALADGVPIVVSDRGGLPALTDPELVFAAGDIDAFATILKTLNNDRDVRVKAGERALERVRANHSEAVFADRLQTVYATAIQRRQS